MRTISQGRRQQSQNGQPTARGVRSVATDLDKLLGPKDFGRTGEAGEADQDQALIK